MGDGVVGDVAWRSFGGRWRDDWREFDSAPLRLLPIADRSGVPRHVDPSSVVDGAMSMGSGNSLSSPSRAADGAGTSAYPERHLASNHPPLALTGPPTDERLIAPYWQHQL